MNRAVLTIGLLGVATVTAATFYAPKQLPPPATAPTPQEQTQQDSFVVGEDHATVELVFVVDTTGSMGGLLQGAKDTVWTVVSELAAQEPRPEVRVGLVAYRDRGDTYVTRQVALSNDLDAFHASLLELRAEGGGDHPEAVNQAMDEALNQMAWTQEPGVYRAIYLVGDAPPHQYADEPPADATARAAKERGIVVNAIQCGSTHAPMADFVAVAQAGGGGFTTVAADGGTVAMAAPMDEELAALNALLVETAVPYGEATERDKVTRSLGRTLSMKLESVASRLSVMNKARKLSSSGTDLVEGLETGELAWSEIEDTKLPADLQGLADDELRAAIEARKIERERLNARIEALVAERDAWIAEERARRRAAGSVAFDSEVSMGMVEELRSLGYVE